MNFDRSAKWALLVASITLATCGVGFRYGVTAANAYLEKRPVPLQQPLDNIPKRLGDWVATGEDQKLTAEVEEALGTAHQLTRAYTRGTGRDAQVIGLHVAYYTGLIDAVPHVADRCFISSGLAAASLPFNLELPLDTSDWAPDPEFVNLRTGEPYPVQRFRHGITGKPMEVRMPVGDIEIRTTEFRDPERPGDAIFAGYFFIANGQTTAYPEGVRVFAFDLTTRYAYYAKVQFTMYAGRGTREEFVDAVADLSNELLPHLMLCLPDWALVERESPEPLNDPTT